MFSRFKPRRRGNSKQKTAPKAETWWEWNRPSGKPKWRWTPFRQQRQVEKKPWIGVAGGLLSAVAGVATLFTLKRALGSKRKSLAQSGQPPGRSHIQISSHPAAQARKGTLGR